ncbi:hypothetical protein JCM30471_08480 [Desulfuromonas carbonis]|uniref:hypothetical protein n=1 Tax=Desulfuromonas sp. DDH964 TaxID=1823759 RepID=UPI00078E3367|nr:hypothetical protein [Desulfuromonas sp. DDH964]AMV72341.1 hypothetical protein DBW_1992 [Desulfuromonas sp. DDH964]
MMHDPRGADVLFILLIALLIWGILRLVSRARGGAGSQQPPPADLPPVARKDDRH